MTYTEYLNDVFRESSAVYFRDGGRSKKKKIEGSHLRLSSIGPFDVQNEKRFEKDKLLTHEFDSHIFFLIFLFIYLFQTYNNNTGNTAHTYNITYMILTYLHEILTYMFDSHVQHTCA